MKWGQKQREMRQLEAMANELQETTAALSEAVTKANDTELEGNPSTMIINFKENANEAFKECIEFKEPYNKQIRDIKKIKLKVGNAEDEVIVTREISSRKKFYPDSSI